MYMGRASRERKPWKVIRVNNYRLADNDFILGTRTEDTVTRNDTWFSVSS